MDYKEVEGKFNELKQQFIAGTLDEAAFKAKLNELMVQDAQGRWWMIGYETGQWYTHDGSAWVRADPPGRVPPQPAQQEKVIADAFTAKPAAEAKKSSPGPAAPLSSAGGKTAPETSASSKVVKKMGWGFWLGWIGSLVAGFAILIWISYSIDNSTLQGIFFGAVVGFLQWLILRRYIQSSWLWIVANVAFMLIVGLAGDAVGGSSFVIVLLVIYVLANQFIGPFLVARSLRREAGA